MAEQAGERTEAPTAKRKQKAADDGDVLKSNDFSSAIVVLAGCFWMAMFGPAMMAACKGLMSASFVFGRADIEDFSPWQPLAEAGWQLAPSLLGLLAMVAVAGVGSQALLSGVTFGGAGR